MTWKPLESEAKMSQSPPGGLLHVACRHSAVPQRHKRNMVALIPGIYWLHFCTFEGSRDVIFTLKPVLACRVVLSKSYRNSEVEIVAFEICSRIIFCLLCFDKVLYVKTHYYFAQIMMPLSMSLFGVSVDKKHFCFFIPADVSWNTGPWTKTSVYNRWKALQKKVIITIRCCNSGFHTSQLASRQLI